MNRHPGLEEWNHLMRALPDDAFMEVMNNYLGGVKTPYNKGDLLTRLGNLLTRPDSMATQSRLTDREDLQILSALHWFRQPDEKFLREFFSIRWSPAAVSRKLMNLEERLLIFRDHSGETPVLTVSPLLPAEILDSLSPARLISLQDGPAPASGEIPWINGSFLICFFSLLCSEGHISNHDGSLKKRFTATLARVFPDRDFDEEPVESLHILINAVKSLSLLSGQSGEWRLRIENLKRFSRLSRQEQLLWVWGALCTTDTARIPDFSALINALARHIPLQSGLTGEDLGTLILILRDRLLPEELAISTGHIIRILRQFRFFLEREGVYYLHPLIPQMLDSRRPEAGSLFLHATFDVNLTPDSPFSLPLAMAAAPERYDSFAQLRISAESFHRLLKGGLNLQDLTDEVETRYGLTIPQNVQFSLRDWEEDYGGTRLWEGIVLEIREDRIPLVEKSGLLKDYIRRTLAPGVYLLSAEDRPGWESALESLGVASIPHIRRPGKTGPRPAEFIALSDRMQYGQKLFEPVLPASSMDEAAEDRPDKHLEELMDHLKNNKTLSAEEKEELADRIRRRILFLEEQIRPGIVRREINMVKGLDYQGKLRMIQSVMGNRSYLLEATLPTEDLDLVVHRIQPHALQNHTGGDAILAGTELPGKPFQCPVRKISLLRKIRTSLF